MNIRPLLDRPPLLATINEHMSDTSDQLIRILDRSFSADGYDTALRRPLTNLVSATLTAAGRSSATQRAYQTAIGLFVEYLDRERGDWLPEDLARHLRPFAEATTERRRTIWTFRPPVVVLRFVDAPLLDGFYTWREAAGDSVNTATLRVCAVRTLLAVALRDGILTSEQALALGISVYRQRRKRVTQPVGRRLTPSEVRLLRSAVDRTTSKGKRDLAILDVMLYLGLRREEVADLDLSNFRQDGGRWWLILTGKGGKLRRLKMHDVLYSSLTAWLQAVGLSFNSDGPVFRSFDRGDHITAKTIGASLVGQLVATYGYAASIAAEHGPNQLSPHDLRRTCARNAYDNGASLLLVQAMLGHEDPKTTAHYIGAFEADDDTAVDYVRY
jgi:integrase